MKKATAPPRAAPMTNTWPWQHIFTNKSLLGIFCGHHAAGIATENESQSFTQ
jgi:hypothetical protein